MPDTSAILDAFHGIASRVLLIFGSGNVVITGCKNLDTAQSALDDLERTLSVV
jgi:TATA-box binding protein (TBP) (component of TFIID and TFIIIB)